MSVDTSRIPIPMKGMCYQPAPTDYIGNQGPEGKYFDTDFYNTDFPGFWSTDNGGRGDLSNMASDLGVNFLHVYNWNAERDHTTFLKECHKQGISAAVPFNNSYCTNISTWGANGVSQIMEEIYTLGGDNKPYASVAMWTIANEYNQTGSPTVSQITKVAQIILYVESILGDSVKLPISSPTSFAPAHKPGIKPTQDLKAAFKASASFTATIGGKTVTIPALPTDFFSTRYVAATNPQNPGSKPPASSGMTIAEWLPDYETAFPDTPVWFSEIGIGIKNSCNGYSSCVASKDQQASFVKNQIESADPEKTSYLLGSSVFEYTIDYSKGVASNDFTFCLMPNGTGETKKFKIPSSAPKGGGKFYPVQCLSTSKPVYKAVKKLWCSTTTSPLEYCATGSS